MSNIKGGDMYDEERAEDAYKTYSGDYPEPIERRSSPLPLSYQEKAIAELHETISQFTSRLKPVLTPANEVDRSITDVDKAMPVQSPLAEQMNANNSGIQKASAKLRALMERLEC